MSTIAERVTAAHVAAWRADNAVTLARHDIERKLREIDELRADFPRLEAEAAHAHAKLDALRGAV